MNIMFSFPVTIRHPKVFSELRKAGMVFPEGSYIEIRWDKGQPVFETKHDVHELNKKLKKSEEEYNLLADQCDLYWKEITELKTKLTNSQQEAETYRQSYSAALCEIRILENDIKEMQEDNKKVDAEYEKFANEITQKLDEANDKIGIQEEELKWARGWWPQWIAQALGISVDELGRTPSMAAGSVRRMREERDELKWILEDLDR
jgi:multidrug resistance efflux pump